MCCFLALFFSLLWDTPLFDTEVSANVTMNRLCCGLLCVCVQLQAGIFLVSYRKFELIFPSDPLGNLLKSNCDFYCVVGAQPDCSVFSLHRRRNIVGPMPTSED